MRVARSRGTAPLTDPDRAESANVVTPDDVTLTAPRGDASHAPTLGGGTAPMYVSQSPPFRVTSVPTRDTSGRRSNLPRARNLRNISPALPVTWPIVRARYCRLAEHSPYDSASSSDTRPSKKPSRNSRARRPIHWGRKPVDHSRRRGYPREGPHDPALPTDGHALVSPSRAPHGHVLRAKFNDIYVDEFSRLYVAKSMPLSP